jgi:hypothetical protein
MKLELKEPPRQFTVGIGDWVTMSDCARVTLAEGELVSVGDTTNRFAWLVVRRRWGFALPTPLARNGALRYVISGKTPASAHLLGHYQDGEPALAGYEEHERHRRFARFPLTGAR